MLNPTNALWKGLMRCQFNLKLNSNQGLFLFIQKQTLRSSRQINLEKQNNEDFFRKNKAIYRKKKCDADDKNQSLKCDRSLL